MLILSDNLRSNNPSYRQQRYRSPRRLAGRAEEHLIRVDFDWTDALSVLSYLDHSSREEPHGRWSKQMARRLKLSWRRGYRSDRKCLV